MTSPDVHPLVVCTCGVVLLRCQDPHCSVVHPLREVPACGACTATGALFDPSVLED